MRRAALAVAVAWIGVSSFSGDVLAQRGRPRRDALELTRVVPARVTTFISVRGLQSLTDLLDATHAWRALSLFGAPGAQDGAPLDLVSGVAQSLGVDPSHSRDLGAVEIGVALADGVNLERAIWFVRLQDPAAVDRWYPPSQRTARAVTGGVLKFRMKDGLIVGVRDDLMVVGRRWPGDAILLDTFRALQGDEVAVLETSEGFQELVRHLQREWRVFAYAQWPGEIGREERARGAVDRGAAAKRGAAQETGVARLLLGLNENKQELEIAVRASMPHGWASPRIEPHAVERLLQLPSSTLAGVVFRPNWSALGAPSDNSPLASLTGNVWRFLVMLYNQSPEGVGDLPSIGPHVVAAWDQDLSAEGSAPEVALLVESDDPGRLRDAITGLFTNWLMLMGRHGGAVPADLRVSTNEHLGQTLHSISLGAFARESAHPLARLCGGLEPSWVSTDQWLVIGLSRAHVERIVDAQRGLVLSVGALQDLRELQRSRTGSTAVFFAQANVASGVMERWVADAERGAPSLLGSQWRAAIAGGKAPVSSRNLGISARQEAGAAVVTAVRSGGASADVLQVGDRIVGIDGQLLSLDSPNADLRRRVQESRATAGPLLRVERDGESIELVVPMAAAAPTEDSRTTTASPDPKATLRELASLGRHVTFVGASVDAADPRSISARASFRFVAAGRAASAKAP